MCVCVCVMWSIYIYVYGIPANSRWVLIKMYVLRAHCANCDEEEKEVLCGNVIWGEFIVDSKAQILRRGRKREGDRQESSLFWAASPTAAAASFKIFPFITVYLWPCACIAQAAIALVWRLCFIFCCFFFLFYI